MFLSLPLSLLFSSEVMSVRCPKEATKRTMCASIICYSIFFIILSLASVSSKC